MSFKDRIEARENAFLNALKECKESGLNTYIWGNGLTARFVEVEGESFHFEGKLVNKAYYSEDMCVGGIEYYALKTFLKVWKVKLI